MTQRRLESKIKFNSSTDSFKIVRVCSLYQESYTIPHYHQQPYLILRSSCFGRLKDAVGILILGFKNLIIFYKNKCFWLKLGDDLNILNKYK